MNLLVELTPEWQPVPTTCDPCSACQEIIYGKQYQMFLNNAACDTVLCEACFMEVENSTT